MAAGERLDEASGDCRVQAGRLGRLCKQQMTAWRQDGFEEDPGRIGGWARFGNQSF